MTAIRLVLSVALLALAASAAGAVTPAEQEAICAEAAGRYQEVYGKAAASEVPPVVMMFKHTFCPVRITVRQGSTIRFVNVDKRTSHSFWFKDAGRPESERFMPGEGEAVTIDLAIGSHAYLCGPHWEHQGMVGTVEVVP